MKKLVSLILSIAVLLAISVPSYAAELKTENPDIYQEKGQLVFDSVELTNVNGNIEIKANSNPAQAQALSVKLEDTEVQQILSDFIDQGKTPVAIGWTKIYLKDSSDPNAIGQVEPMTIADVQNSSHGVVVPYGTGTGTPTVKGNFTLYTLAGFDNYDPTALFASSVGKWSGGVGGSNGPETLADDFMTMTWPSGHVLLASGLLGTYFGGYKHDEGYGSVVFGFGEKKGTVTLSTTGRQDSSSGTRKWISNYVHTWGETVPTFNIAVGDLGISLTDTTISWTIASSVIY